MPLFRVPQEDDLRKMEATGMVTSLALGTLGLIAGLILITNNLTWGWAILVSAALSELMGIALLVSGRHRRRS